MIQKILIYIILVFVNIHVYSHSGKAKFHLIVDTDCATDDLRALCMFLAHPDFEIMAVTTSDGAVPADVGFQKVKSLLHDFGHQGIPVAMGRTTGYTEPNWTTIPRLMDWGDKSGNNHFPPDFTAIDLIKESIELEDGMVTVISMGSLTNITAALNKYPNLSEKIDRVIWYNDGVFPAHGTNYKLDPTAFYDLLKMEVELEVLSNLKKPCILFDDDMVLSLENTPSVYGQRVFKSFTDIEILEHDKFHGFMIWDDLLPAYLLSPELFIMEKAENYHQVQFVKDYDLAAVKAVMVEILTLIGEDEGILFKKFPLDPAYYKQDVSEVMHRIITRHGHKEWRVMAITNEFHEHLGIYSIVGAKMGLRAREYFHVGLDEIEILSFAGFKPPLSCLSDGLQVSTGATLGHGTIRVSDSMPTFPGADFTFKNTTMQLVLKEEHAKEIYNDIQAGIRMYGFRSGEYWDFVRKLGLKYWLEWDRKEIFDINKVEKN